MKSVSFWIYMSGNGLLLVWHTDEKTSVANLLYIAKSVDVTRAKWTEVKLNVESIIHYKVCCLLLFLL